MKLADVYISQFVEKLADEGYRLISKAFDEADYRKDKTQNLHDSYGSAVYYRGKIYPNSQRYFSKLATTAKYDQYREEMITGRRAIQEYLRSYKPASQDMELIIVVAMFYGKILEEGKNLRHKYKVISMVGTDVRQLANKIGKETEVFVINT